MKTNFKIIRLPFGSSVHSLEGIVSWFLISQKVPKAVF